MTASSTGSTPSASSSDFFVYSAGYPAFKSAGSCGGLKRCKPAHSRGQLCICVSSRRCWQERNLSRRRVANDCPDGSSPSSSTRLDKAVTHEPPQNGTVGAICQHRRHQVFATSPVSLVSEREAMPFVDFSRVVAESLDTPYRQRNLLESSRSPKSP